jgi:hypothetical protein
VSTNPNYRRYPSSLGPVVVVLLIIGGMALLITGSWRLSDGLNGVVIDHTNPYVHFSETTAAQEVTDGIIYSVLGVTCFMAFTALYIKKRSFLFPPQKEKPKQLD